MLRVNLPPFKSSTTSNWFASTIFLYWWFWCHSKFYRPKSTIWVSCGREPSSTRLLCPLLFVVKHFFYGFLPFVRKSHRTVLVDSTAKICPYAKHFIFFPLVVHIKSQYNVDNSIKYEYLYKNCICLLYSPIALTEVGRTCQTSCFEALTIWDHPHPFPRHAKATQCYTNKQSSTSLTHTQSPTPPSSLAHVYYLQDVSYTGNTQSHHMSSRKRACSFQGCCYAIALPGQSLSRYRLHSALLHLHMKYWCS